MTIVILCQPFEMLNNMTIVIYTKSRRRSSPRRPLQSLKQSSKQQFSAKNTLYQDFPVSRDKVQSFSLYLIYYIYLYLYIIYYLISKGIENIINYVTTYRKPLILRAFERDRVVLNSASNFVTAPAEIKKRRGGFHSTLAVILLNALRNSLYRSDYCRCRTR